MTDTTPDSDEITVELGWSETVQYTSKITLEVSAIREWMVNTASTPEDDALTEITDEIVNDYLRDQDESFWYEKIYDPDEDFTGVSERDIDHDGAEIVTDTTPDHKED